MKKEHITMLLLFLCSALLGSCEKKQEYPEFVIPTRVSFEKSSYVIGKDETQGLTIGLKLARPLEKDGAITLQLQDDNTTATASEFTVSPGLVDGKLSISLPKGTSTVSFTVKSLHNFDGNKTVAFRLTKGTGGAVLDERNLDATIMLRGNDWEEPTMTTSATAALDFGNVTVNTQSAAQTYTLTGINLSEKVTVKASDNFKVSLDNTTYASSVNVDANDKSVDIYVKFTPISGQNQSLTGKITHSLAGMDDVVVDVVGEETGNVADVPLLVEDLDYGASDDFLLRLTPNRAAYSE